MAAESNTQQPPRLHGRGGAGNVQTKAATGGGEVQAQDFSTPTIKSNTYTTGRGGQGNMATNLPDFPEYSRAAQDVDTPAHHEKEAKGVYHWGRGGEGNAMMVGSAKAPTNKASGEGLRPTEKHQRSGSFQGIMEKGKEMLGMGKGAKAANGEKSPSPVTVEK
ncbi:hypothetical protein LTR17_020815 [Elasticomyces elasticus]|nr:hypothetical protein LTR17_020815 [Elasticomyces elasticus]